jgi:HD-GYP domain-containing protein (c-di-GMP phosphodiesterase class II)
MLSALLSDLGILYLDPKITRKLRNNDLENLTALERDEYIKHPSISLDVVLERKLPISPVVRNIISCTHERIDGSGFPRGIRGEKIPKISELIQIAQLIDQATCVRLGQARIDKSAFMKSFFEREFEQRRFSMDLIAQLSKKIC